MFDFVFYCRELEGFILRNQIQTFVEGDPDTLFVEQMLLYIQKEALQVSEDQKKKYPQLPWKQIETLWEKDWIRTSEFMDLKMMYHIAVYEIPKFTKAIRLT